MLQVQEADREEDQLDDGLAEIIQLCKKLQEDARKRKTKISVGISQVQAVKD